jgi:elongation factor P
MFSINDLRVGTIFIWKKEPYKVLESKHVFVARGASSLQAKIKSLISGNVYSQSFKPADKFDEADINFREIKYLYNHRGEFWFCEKENSSQRFFLEEKAIGSQKDFLKPNTLVRAMVFEDKIVDIILPIKIDLKVTEAPPGAKGETAQRNDKLVTLETGAQIKAPLFIHAGDIVRINTETRSYTERVQKS